MDNNSIPREDPYHLARDEKASARLSAQALLFQLKSGWLLHPAVAASVKDKKDIEVADLAAGNGIFALHLAEERPDAKIVALDISEAQYPPRWTRPPNTRWGLWDLFDPVPGEFVGRFDVVHLRLMIGATYGRDKTFMINNLVKLLKPGGYLQWAEAVADVFHQVDGSLGLMPGLSSYQRVMDEKSPMFSNAQLHVNTTKDLRNHGLVNVERFDHPVKPYLLGFETYCALWSLNEMEETIKRNKSPDSEYIAELDAGREELSRDIVGGQRWAYNVPVFIGMKPM